ncbi:pyridoxamine 5'-phosphate oxidase family protein [Nonomuraea endophytica]|uniref:Nitroimidazol reductase NimA-like FMN-containing flavoprotein (Pyridoxamine 5'-phosphate oxidase superfamily) n=1 Tax=Nonomuraea endophytica TaxID=714136 RepID=A0A7W8ELB1_9ACTN|nr:pyridoxamine 5'-phosphate oxidase family protein [Nonomuraea endophytica]MBB5083471.1 nitroimidazol reductase NimA-like FMN-containing flavoprotein (pyridoxamine 5'-phosphate oxidase superfamily) [Nonomuraea endophytica]
MNQRARIAMPEADVTALIEGSRKLQLATINPDGTPHLVTMYYGLDEGRIAFWTYGKAQKAVNLARDPRVSCLIETGDDYAELRGVLLYGVAKQVGEHERVLEIGLEIARRMTPGVPDADLRPYVELTGRKRIAYVVERTKVVSWDHRRLT